MQKLHSFRTSGTNLSRAKTHNHNVVLEVIRLQGSISRTEIARITSLSRQTIQNIVTQLETANLVRMKAGKIVGRGHPGMEVSLNADAAFCLGLQVDRTRMTAVACNLVGEKIWDTTQVFSDSTVEAANSGIVDAIDLFRTAMPEPFSRLVGCGIAAPGPFGPSNLRKGAATTFHEFGSSQNLAALEDRIGLPIVLENDASAAAVGESFYGGGKSRENFAFLQFGIGLGAGFIINGNPYSGTWKNAGEIGHVVVELDGLPCSCGNSGCLERYLSLDALCRHLNISPVDPASFDSISDLAHRRDPCLMGWIDVAVPRLRQAINILEATLDPETIIVGGTAPGVFLDLLIERARPFFKPVAGNNPDVDRVARGVAGRLSIALGAAAVSISAHFAPSVSRLVL